AGEIARDLAKYAELPDVLAALAAGSPLDALDDDLRDGGFLARRRLRRLNPETLAIGWRSVVSRLGAAVEFRD
ncbi:MAG: DNA primase, partial [Actinobacteria bacterium]|nr:DNA primase [Actinomycetota bacterium]